MTCNQIAEGNGESERIGRKLNIRSIQWTYTVELQDQGNSANPSGNETLRVVLYLDKQTNGATATVTGIMESDDYQSFRNLSNASRFQILHDKSYDLGFHSAAGDGTAANDWGGESKTVKFYRRCNIPIEYDNSATTGAITSIRSNNLGVLLFARRGVTGGFDSKMRLRYSDS